VRPTKSNGFLYPRGTKLADVPPLHRGLNETEWVDFWIQKAKQDLIDGTVELPEPVAPVSVPRRNKRGN
jgi:hypothetical protein